MDNKFGNGVFVAIATHSANDFLILHQRQEQLHEFRTVRRLNGVQDFSDKVPAGM